MNFIRKLLQHRKDHLQFLIGYSQVALKDDIPYIWVIFEAIRFLQLIAILFVYNKFIQKCTNIIQPQSYEMDKLQSLSEIIVPCLYIIDWIQFSNVYVLQIIVLIILLLMIIITMLAMRIEYLQFEGSTLQNKRLFSKMEGNKYQSLSILNNTYNNGNFVEHFLLKQLMKVSNESWIDFQLAKVSQFANYFTHIILVPFSYQILIIFLYLYYFSVQIPTSNQVIIYILNGISIPALLIVELLSIEMQQSYRLNDSNFLRLTVSNYFKLNQFLKLSGPLIYFLTLIFIDATSLTTSSTLFKIVGSCVIITLLFDIYDQFYYLPYVQPYKVKTYNLFFAISISVTSCVLLDARAHSLITISIISTPGICKILNLISETIFTNITKTTLQCETRIYKVNSKLRRRSSHTFSKSFMVLEDQHQIEKVVYKQREERIKMIKKTKHIYFLQFMRMFELLKIQEQQVIQVNDKIKYEKSRFYIQCVILIKSHVSQCSNVYCYCRGLRGEKRDLLERNTIQQPMKIYDDFICDGVLISIDLIKRYIHSYIKLVINILTFTQPPDLTQISQLLVPLCQSEESFQTWLVVMELKTQLKDLKKPYNPITLNLIMSYAKFSTLYKAQFLIESSEVKKSIVYEDYRTSERQRTTLSDMIFKGLENKKRFLLKLHENNLNHENLQDLFVRNVKESHKIEKELNYFYDQSQCKTSCLLLMFFYLELYCDYAQFGKYFSLLKTKETKFFEIPTFSPIFHQVCFLKVNLSRFSKSKVRGEIITNSDNSPQFFGYSKEEFNYNIRTVHSLVHPLISVVHNTIIELYLMSNKPNVLRRERNLLAQKKGNEVVFVEIFLDFCFQITDSEFPVYCFLKEIKPFGMYENIRGHLVIDDEDIIRGASKLAYQSFLKEDYDWLINLEINQFMPNYRNIVNKLQEQLEAFLKKEKEKLSQKSEQNNFDTTSPNGIYNRFHMIFQEQKFNISAHENFLIDFQLMLIFGIIDGVESKFFVMEIHKVQQNDYSTYDLIEESLFSSIQQTVNEEKKQNDVAINFQTYQMQNSIQDNLIQLTNNNIQNNDLVSQQLIPVVKHSLYFNSAHYQQSESKFDGVQMQSSYRIITPNSKVNSEKQKIINKAQLYQEFTSNQKSLLGQLFIDGINIVIMIVIITFLLVFQLKFRSQAFSVMPTIQILQAFITTDYTDNIQLAIIYHKQTTTDLFMDDSISQVLRLLQKDALMYIKYQKEYFLNDQIKNVFTDTQLNTIDGQNQSAWNAAFEILLNQQGYLNLENQTNFYLNQSFKNLLREFPNHKLAYEEINLKFNNLVLQSILDFSTLEKFLIYIFIAFVLFIALVAYFIFNSYFILLKKYSRCCEQVYFEAIINEIKIIDGLLQNKKFNIYESKFDIANKKHQRIVDFQSHYSQYRSQKNIKNQKKQLYIHDQFSIKRQAYFLIPLGSLLIGLMFLIITYNQVQTLMDDLYQDIILFNQGILFQQSFSLVCFSGIILENRNYLLQKNYITTLEIEEYYKFANQSLIDVFYLSKAIRLPSQLRSNDIITILSQNICLIFDDDQDIKECNRIYDGFLTQGILEASSEYINTYRNNLAINYNESYIIPTKADDVIAINFIIKAITSYVQYSRISLEQYIITQINEKFNSFVLAFTICMILQLLIILLVSNSFRKYTQKLKKLIYLLPRETLYQEDSLMKTLMYVQRTQNDCCQ